MVKILLIRQIVILVHGQLEVRLIAASRATAIAPPLVRATEAERVGAPSREKRPGRGGVGGAAVA